MEEALAGELRAINDGLLQETGVLQQLAAHSKDASQVLERLLEHIRQAATGQMTLSPQLTQILAQALRGDDRSKSLDELTERERQILRQIAHGYSNKMIARKLDITEGTVKVHVKRVLHKLGMRSRVEAAVWAVENDLV